MIRVQIQLEPEEHHLLERRARRSGLSVSQLVRQAIRKELGLDDAVLYTDEAMADLLGVAGIAQEPDARRDVAESHDEILYGTQPW